MTTRTTILKQAQHRFEKFNRSGFSDLSKYELEIKFYSKIDKAKILYNHMFHSGMSSDQYDVFFTSKNYLKIINHKNYFPRLIEFITSENQLKNISANETEKFIFNSLNNPKEIWHFAYEQQLNEEEKFLLLTLFSLGGYNIDSEQLEKAFEARYNYEVKENGFTLRSDAYQQSLKKLLDGFIKSEKDSDTGVVIFSFLNPSIADFIINFLKERSAETKRILNSATYFKQITGYFRSDDSDGIKLTQTQLKQYYSQFNLLLPTMLASSQDQSKGSISAIFVLINYFAELTTEQRLLNILTEMIVPISSNFNFEELRFVLSNLHKYNSIKQFIINDWQLYFEAAVRSAKDDYDIGFVIELFQDYDIVEESWSNDLLFMEVVKASVNRIYSCDDLDFSYTEDRIYNDYHDGYQSSALRRVEEIISENYSDFLDNCALANYFEQFYPDANVDSQEVLGTVLSNYRHSGDDYNPTDRIMGSNQVDNENLVIEQLFER